LSSLEVLLLLLVTSPAEARTPPETCTYSTYAWHVGKRKSVDHQKVSKPYSEVTAEERCPKDERCTVCEEDQVWVEVEGIPRVRVCHAWAEKVRSALGEISRSAFRVRQIEGYRPGRTRGKVVDGKRSEWSNHAFGVAVDLNRGQNGLYVRCRLPAGKLEPEVVAKRCKLAQGGRWQPLRNKRTTIVEGGPAHTAFTRFWRWGGRITGATRDFMHFSVDGR